MDRYARILAGVDLLAALVGVALALLRTEPNVPRWMALAAAVLLPLSWLAALTMARCYEPRFLGDGGDPLRRLLDIGLRFMGVIGLYALIDEGTFSRLLALLALPFMLAVGATARLVGDVVLRRAQRRGVATHRAIVVGTERAVDELLHRLDSSSDHAIVVVGALVDRCAGSEVGGVAIVGTSHDVRRALREKQCDTLIVTAWSMFSQQELRELSWELEDTKVDILVTPNLTDVAGTRISVRPVVGMPLLHVERPEFTGSRRVMKSMFDRTTALLALILLTPLLALLALAVKIDSRGPAFYSATRVGRNGRTFTMHKLRTMCERADSLRDEVAHGNEHAEGPLFKMKQDPRITRVGSFLRRTSLDELPQLLNVVTGSMSLVGPRPPLPGEVEQYGDHVHRRFLVKPGLTGLWQVSGRADLPWDESVRLDLYYVENWSFLMDLSILSRTVRAVVAGRGAY